MLAVAICVTTRPMPALEKITFLSDNFVFFSLHRGRYEQQKLLVTVALKYSLIQSCQPPCV